MAMRMTMAVSVVMIVRMVVIVMGMIVRHDLDSHRPPRSSSSASARSVTAVSLAAHSTVSASRSSSRPA